MCGIVGFVSKNKEESLIQKFTSEVSHRGPDESNFTIIKSGDYFLHFGSTRLSIVGSEFGRMPMKDSLGNQLIYNGELYDLKKFKNFLNLEIKTTSDTYHLFKLLSETEDKNLSQLNGMFAFAYYDSKNESILLARDKLGIKPLYYLTSDEYPLVFSSEIKPIIKLNFSKRTIYRKTIEEYLIFGGINKYSNLIDDIHSIEPGQSLTWKKNNIKIEKFYNVEKKLNTVNNDLESLLVEVIDDQLKADVNVDILLSGGIDSSLISFITGKILGKNVSAFSLTYSNKNFDELKKSSKISSELNLNHEIIAFNEETNYEIIDELISVLPEPIADPSIVPTYYLNKIVSQYTKAVLTGDGADELFSGYDWYRASLITPYVKKYMFSLLKSFSKLNDSLSSKKNISLKDKMELFLMGQNFPIQTRVLHWQNSYKYLPQELINKYFKEYLEKLELDSSLNRIDHTQIIDINTYMYTNILKKSDTASMLNGLEARPVYLDDRILEYSMSKNQSQNVSLFKSKIELRKYVQKFSSLHNQKKQGFTHDFGNWIEYCGVPYLNSIKNHSSLVSNYLNSKNNTGNSNSFSSLEARNIWSLYSLYKWIEVNNINLKETK